MQNCHYPVTTGSSDNRQLRRHHHRLLKKMTLFTDCFIFHSSTLPCWLSAKVGGKGLGFVGVHQEFISAYRLPRLNLASILVSMVCWERKKGKQENAVGQHLRSERIDLKHFCNSSYLFLTKTILKLFFLKKTNLYFNKTFFYWLYIVLYC